MRRSIDRPAGQLVCGLVAGCLGLLVVGCGAQAAPVAGSPPPSSAAATPSTELGSAPSTSTGPPGPGSTAPRSTTPGPSGPAVETTLSGMVVEGAQPSCRNLQTDDDGRWTLTGEPAADLAIGVQVTVSGTPRPDLISPCGRVFVVTSRR